MNDDGMQDTMRSGTERVVIPPLDLSAITARGRRLRTRRSALIAAASTLVVAVSIPLAVALTRSETRLKDLQPSEVLPAGGPVTDGDVTFEVVTVQCSEDSFDVEGPYCYAEARVTIESAELVSLQDGWQALHFGNQRIVADNEPFAEYYDDYFTSNHAFGAPLEAKVPSGGLFFQGVPAGECPDAIEFHSAEDSAGVVQQIDDCLLDEGQGRGDVSGQVFSGRTEGGRELTATIEAKDGEICFEIPDAGGYKAAHLHLRTDPKFGDPVLAVFFEPPAEPATSGCVRAEKFDEEALSSGDTTQYVDLHAAEDERVVLEREVRHQLVSPDASEDPEQLLAVLESTEWTQKEPYGIDLEIVENSEKGSNLVGSVVAHYLVEEGLKGERSSGGAVRIYFFVFTSAAGADQAATEHELRTMDLPQGVDLREPMGPSRFCATLMGSSDECHAVVGNTLVRVVSALPSFELSDEFHTEELMEFALAHLREVQAEGD